MSPAEVGVSYNATAERWQNQEKPLTGLEQHARTLQFLLHRRFALSVQRKLCGTLTPEGILIFTMGGTDHAGDSRDDYMGMPRYQASLGIPKTLELLAKNGCACRHLEHFSLC